MAGGPGGLTASIRRKLQQGMDPDEIVKELVAGGKLTENSAQRFVDRAVAEHASAPELAPLPEPGAPADSHDQFAQPTAAHTEPAAESTGGASLWVASALMCGGVLITGVSYIMAEPGERYTLMWGPIAFG